MSFRDIVWEVEIAGFYVKLKDGKYGILLPYLKKNIFEEEQPNSLKEEYKLYPILKLELGEPINAQKQ